MQTEQPCMLFVHAHPDDETITTGATIAHYAAQGVDVHVVTCTLGEEGEVIGERWAQLSVDHADQLGGYRIAELCSALHLLGIGDPIFLGGAGHWRDSGMAGTDARPGLQRFVDADEREAVGALVEIIRELRPHVVVTYDPNGGYGHPDHIRTHQITTAAIAAAADPAEYPGRPWQVGKFYWTVVSTTAMQSAIAALTDDDLLEHWQRPPADLDFGFPDDQITAMVDATEGLAAKIDALAAHATQVAVGPTGRAAALSNNLALPVLGHEHYILAAGKPGPRDERGWETDLLAGLVHEY
ncbi:1D-myo-inositol 2-acetamido-2-deoxy-alpha-D-glucopyranoside deacetylase [Mycolicibacterium chitae]|nr:N-acetyl-1-D-myo-inositol-2-amino-2-deoxy-alpha-D-glucopyranoside deacetylase [Mycolicibacterium chitae]MCV7105732.1 N-acetyl-1-D-myo-inositol-2-amino-2-deoxy-alpha-D-glucopyranoside deacetylase [Mycolicibacterium chitae]BBZ03199.1 1D-myo-inositol 2-acetamido-2-deoxy-alpha-D-glucopyranoside deacetylase [Mycolicibacterium chitae]